MNNSAALTAAYIITLPEQALAPAATPAGGYYAAEQSVILASPTEGAAIYYTTDGTDPTAASTLYENPILISETAILKAIAVKEGVPDSTILTAAYIITLPGHTVQPMVTPVGGNYTAAQTVALSSATEGAAIYYTTDGTDPTAASARYANPIAINKTTTLKAIAVKEGFIDSAIMIETYAFTALAPMATPAGGNYTAARIVALSSATEDADIYYTIDETAPTKESTLYEDAIAINETTILKAIAVKEGFTDSPILTETYTITPAGYAAQPVPAPISGNYTGAQNVTLESATKGAFIYYTLDGTTPTAGSTLYKTPVTISETTTLKAIAVIEGMYPSGVTSAVYTIAVFAPVAAPPAGTYTGARGITLKSATEGALIYYTLDGTAPTTGSALYEAPIVISAPATIKAIAVKEGMASSEAMSAAYTIRYTVTFDSTGGNELSPAVVNYGSSVSQPSSNPVKPGFDFAGWYADSECTVPWNFASDTVNGDITIYAKWTVTIHTVNFDTCGGSAVPPQQIPRGGTVTAPPVPAKEGFTFIGWYADSACTDAWNFASDTVNGNITIYAKWIETVVAYTVRFESNGGSAVASFIVNEGDTFTLPEPPTRTGYIFGGWYNAGLTSKWNFANPVTADMTLYAKWYSADDDNVEDFGPGAQVNQVFSVTATIEWLTALNAIRGGGNDKNYIINIGADFPLPVSAGNTFGELTGLKVSIRGNSAASMPAGSAKGSVLRIIAGQTVVVRDVDFVGMANNNTSLIYLSDGALTLRGSASVSGNTAYAYSNSYSSASSNGGGVYVSGGTFTMQDTATISGNTAYSYSTLTPPSSNGGGVYVSGGTFSMQDTATISGNIAYSYYSFSSSSSYSSSRSYGGGVYVSGGTFCMQDTATISGNKVSYSAETSTSMSPPSPSLRGGGVYVGGGTFRIANGTIYGNNDGTDSNTASVAGAALYKSGGIAEYGIFLDTFFPVGTLVTTSNTIKVVNGELQQ